MTVTSCDTSHTTYFPAKAATKKDDAEPSKCSLLARSDLSRSSSIFAAPPPPPPEAHPPAAGVIIIAQLTGPQQEMEAATKVAVAAVAVSREQQQQQQQDTVTISKYTINTSTNTIHCVVSRSSSCDNSNIQQEQQQQQQDQQQTITTHACNNNEEGQQQQQQNNGASCCANALVARNKRKLTLLSTQSAPVKKRKIAPVLQLGNNMTACPSAPPVDMAKTVSAFSSTSTSTTLLENHQTLFPTKNGSPAKDNTAAKSNSFGTIINGGGADPPPLPHQQQVQEKDFALVSDNAAEVGTLASCQGNASTMSHQQQQQQQPTLLQGPPQQFTNGNKETNSTTCSNSSSQASAPQPPAAAARTSTTHASSCLEFLSPTGDDDDDASTDTATTTTVSSVDDDDDDDNNALPAASSTTGTKSSLLSLFGSSTTPQKQPETEPHPPSPPAGREKNAPGTTIKEIVIDHDKEEEKGRKVSLLVALLTAVAAAGHTSVGKSALSASASSLSMIPAAAAVPPVVKNGSSKHSTTTSSQENKQAQESSTTAAAAASASNKRNNETVTADSNSARSSNTHISQNQSSFTTIQQTELTEQDIVLGGGAIGFKHAGQKAYIQFLNVITNVFAKDYVIGESNEVLIHRVVDHVENQHEGRFLEQHVAFGVEQQDDSSPTLFHLVPRNKVCDKIEILLRRAFDRLPRIPTPTPPTCQMNVAVKQNKLGGDDEDDDDDDNEADTEMGSDEEESSSSVSQSSAIRARPDSSSFNIPAKKPAVTNANLRLPPPSAGGGKCASTSSHEQTENGETSLLVPPPVSGTTTNSTRHDESPSSSIRTLKNKDIVMGRGNFTKHTGNANCRDLVTKFANFYLPGNKSHNDALVLQILDHISSHGGRFVEEDTHCVPRGSTFRLAARSKVEAKVAILLQRRYHYIRSSSSLAKSNTGDDGDDAKDGDFIKESTRKAVDATASRTYKPSSKAHTRSDTSCSSTKLPLTNDDASAAELTCKVAASDARCTDKPSSEGAIGADDTSRSATSPLTLNKDDVCIGRQFLFHPGNVAFRAVVAEVAQGQTHATQDMVNAVIERITSSGGRFLEMLNGFGVLRLASKMQVNEKISVALHRRMQSTSIKSSNGQPLTGASANLRQEEESDEGEVDSNAAAMSVIARVKFPGRSRSKPVRFAPSIVAAPVILDDDHDKMDEDEMEKCAGKLAKQRKVVGGCVKVHPNDVGLHKSGKKRWGLRKSRSPPMASDNGNDATVPDAPTSTTIFVPRNNSNNSKKREFPREPPAGQAPYKRHKSASNSVIAFEQQKSQPIMKPGPTDVLCVKGQPKMHQCPGEKYLRVLIRKYRDKYYHSADPTKRDKIRAKIENLIQSQSPPGRFLELDKTTKTYHVASDERVSKKLTKALSRRDNMQRSFKKTPPPQQQSTTRDQGTRIRRPPIHATPASQRHFITVNSRVSVLWVLLNAYFPGTIEEIILPPYAADADATADGDGASSICYYNIRYDDDTTEMVDLMRRKFKILQLAKQEEQSGEGDDDDRKPAAI